MDALNRHDVNAFEQNKNALGKTSTEGLEKLKAVQLYKSDGSLVKACQQLLKFYNEESTTKMAALSKFLISKENYEKIKAAFDAIPEKSRTKEDIDKINKAGAEFNKDLTAYNTTNQELNKKRSELLDNWNKASSEFTDKHIPRK